MRFHCERNLDAVCAPPVPVLFYDDAKGPFTPSERKSEKDQRKEKEIGEKISKIFASAFARCEWSSVRLVVL